jgi:hypothetical protein
MCSEGALDLTHCIVHVSPPLADLHVLETGLNTEKDSESLNQCRS